MSLRPDSKYLRSIILPGILVISLQIQIFTDERRSNNALNAPGRF
jgi:hypothetical protein